jgi:hypothetical protein
MASICRMMLGAQCANLQPMQSLLSSRGMQSIMDLPPSSHRASACQRAAHQLRPQSPRASRASLMTSSAAPVQLEECLWARAGKTPQILELCLSTTTRVPRPWTPPHRSNCKPLHWSQQHLHGATGGLQAQQPHSLQGSSRTEHSMSCTLAHLSILEECKAACHWMGFKLPFQSILMQSSLAAAVVASLQMGLQLPQANSGLLNLGRSRSRYLRYMGQLHTLLVACQASSRAKQPCLAARVAQATCNRKPQPWFCHAGCRMSSCQVLISRSLSGK